MTRLVTSPRARAGLQSGGHLKLVLLSPPGESGPAGGFSWRLYLRRDFFQARLTVTSFFQSLTGNQRVLGFLAGDRFFPAMGLGGGVRLSTEWTAWVSLAGL